MAKPNIKKIRKEAVTFSMLSDATDTILTGVQKMFDKLENKVDFNHTDLKHQISDLKYDTPSLKDFESLKKRVDLFYPLS